MKCKTSYGIALCRYNTSENNRIEVLLIKKRFSYNFYSFVYGTHPLTEASLKLLLSGMSVQEKLDVYSLQFNYMWYRIWLSDPEKQYSLRDIDERYVDAAKLNQKLYNQKKSKFIRSYLGDDGKWLRKQIERSSDADIMWEVPKGRKKDRETDADCAIREFNEETCIRYNQYTILFSIPPIVEEYVDNDIMYKNVYFIATPKKAIQPHIRFSNFDQITEVAQIKWIAAQDLKMLHLHVYMYKRIHVLYTRIVEAFRHYNHMRPHD